MKNNDDNRYLNTYACYSSDSRGRMYSDEPLILGRSEFQRDRDRIIHSEAFRRLKDKTQVFVYHEGDHYRTRLTHTLEVSQIARSIAKALKINEDLSETIALAHDLGHPPLGHRGEDVLKKLMINYDGFNHNEQSIRVVTFLEKKYPNFNGLNLTFETLEGLVKHNGPFYNKKIPQTIQKINKIFPLDLYTYPSLEGQVANISDDIAYLTHDFDDGLRESLFTINDLCKIKIIDEIVQKLKKEFVNIKIDILTHQFIRHLISYFINDVVSNSLAVLNVNNFENVDQIRFFEDKIIKLSPTAYSDMEEIRSFLFKNMYNNDFLTDKLHNNSLMIEKLFFLFHKDFCLLPEQWKNFKGKISPFTQARVVADYIAGMTDGFLKKEYKKYFDKEN